MTRLLLSISGGLLLSIALWFVVGFPAALLLGRMPGGQREGMGAMTGFFYVGAIGGIIGLVAGVVLVWRYTSDAARYGQVALWLGGLLAVMVITGAVVMAPAPVSRKEIPGRILIEAKLPASIASPKDVIFEMRSSGEFYETHAQASAAHTQDGRVIVPGSFPLGSKSGVYLFALMNGESQLDVQTMQLPASGAQTTGWNQWQVMNQGSEVRWRLMLGKE